MGKKLKKIWLVLVLMVIIFSLGGCRSHPMTTKELLEVQDKYERGKISDEDYLEALDAYYNGDPAPKRGIMKLISNIFGFIGELIGAIIVLIVIAFIISIFRKRDN